VNFLAHFHLAWPDQGLIAGGLEGDFYKGPLRDDLPGAVAQGVQLHRAIDAYTDQHPTLKALRGELPPHLRRFAGIVIDLSFDHYLSLHWDRFSDQPLALFNQKVYRVLCAHRDCFSARTLQMLERLLEHDILGLYTEWDTVTATAARIGQRFGQRNPFYNLDSDLAAIRPQLEQGFLNFYPDLQSFSSTRVIELASTATRANIAPETKSP